MEAWLIVVIILLILLTGPVNTLFLVFIIWMISFLIEKWPGKSQHN